MSKNFKSMLIRSEHNPLFRPEDFPYGAAEQVFNPGQVMTPDGRTILLLSVTMRNERFARCHVAESRDGIHFDIHEKPLFEVDPVPCQHGAQRDENPVVPVDVPVVELTVIEHAHLAADRQQKLAELILLRTAQQSGAAPAVATEDARTFECLDRVVCVEPPGGKLRRQLIFRREFVPDGNLVRRNPVEQIPVDLFLMVVHLPGEGRRSSLLPAGGRKET